MNRNDATGIPLSIKEIVAERDSFDGWPCCVLCGRPAPERLAYSNAHYISRAQNGRGVPENIVTLCPECHRRYDQTTDRQQLKAELKQYLKECYPGWDEEQLIYKKGNNHNEP